MNIEKPISREQRLKEAKHWLAVINKSFETGNFETRDRVLDIFPSLTFFHNPKAHILILASRGGIDSHLDHLYYFLAFLKKHNTKAFVHLFSDGQDVPEKQFLLDLPEIEQKIKESGCTLASISGRFYAMDEGENWDRVDKVWHAFMKFKGTPVFKDAQEYVKSQYQTTSDKWIVPAISEEYAANGGLGKNDLVFNLNFLEYGDRQLCSVLAGSDLYSHDPTIMPHINLYVMVNSNHLMNYSHFFERWE